MSFLAVEFKLTPPKYRILSNGKPPKHSKNSEDFWD
jgi:hypothetical protein